MAFLFLDLFDIVNLYITFSTMEEKKLQSLKVDRTKLITQTKYAQKNGMSKQLVNQQIKTGKINSIEIIGATLVLLD